MNRACWFFEFTDSVNKYLRDLFRVKSNIDLGRLGLFLAQIHENRFGKVSHCILGLMFGYWIWSCLRKVLNTDYWACLCVKSISFSFLFRKINTCFRDFPQLLSVWLKHYFRVQSSKLVFYRLHLIFHFEPSSFQNHSKWSYWATDRDIILQWRIP